MKNSIPSSTRQLQLTAYGDPNEVVRLENVNLKELEPDELLVSMKVVPIHKSDFMFIGGIYAMRPEPPSPIGGEGIGEVIDAGSRNTDLIGKKVFVLPTHEQFTWADHVVVARHNLVVIDVDVDMVQLGMVGLNGITAYALLSNYTKLMPGDWIAQTGANSAVGQYIIALAKMAGVKTLNIVRSEQAAALVKAAGGDKVVILGDDLQDKIGEALGGEKLSLVVDNLGSDISTKISPFLKRYKPVVVYSIETGIPPTIGLIDLFFKKISWHGLWASDFIRNTPANDIAEIYQQLAKWVATGQLHAKVEKTYTLDQYKEEIAHALTPQIGGKILFKF